MFLDQSVSASSKARARRAALVAVARAAALAALLAGAAVDARPFWRLQDLLAPPSRALAESHVPHPAVARIIVPERDGTAFGSGTLVDVRNDYGLVITNHHVVAHASGPIEVVFPGGFRSHARSLKMDSEWDLAALVIWRPEEITPVPLAARAPQPGDVLTICGYGQGQYRSITGRCTDYYAPSIGMPRELVELDVEARQGDSGGPIFNSQNELAGVLFGAGQGTTLGSFGGRVKGFLASVAPDIGIRTDDVLVASAEVDSAPRKETAKPQAGGDAGFAEWKSAAPKQAAVTPAAAHESKPPSASSPPSTPWIDGYMPLSACVALGAFFVMFVRLVK